MSDGKKMCDSSIGNNTEGNEYGVYIIPMDGDRDMGTNSISNIPVLNEGYNEDELPPPTYENTIETLPYELSIEIFNISHIQYYYLS